MTLQQLRYVTAVADTGAISRAVLLDAGRNRPAGGVRILFYNAVGCGILSSITLKLYVEEDYYEYS